MGKCVLTAHVFRPKRFLVDGATLERNDSHPPFSHHYTKKKNVDQL